MPSWLTIPIKLLATVVIIMAIALEFHHLADLNYLPLWLQATPILWFCHLALLSHTLEAAIAVLWVTQSPALAPIGAYPRLRTILYTFFVGTLSLGELYSQRRNSAP